MVLAEEETHLQKRGIAALKAPKDFWKKLNRRPAIKVRLPRDARSALDRTLPERGLVYLVVRREAGLGSLDQHRFVGIAECNGGFIAREAKRLVPAANAWLRAKVLHSQSYYERALASAIRSRDPTGSLSRGR
jgi:hypothetical protein